MYDTHQPVIENAMRNDPDAFLRGCLFALLSIRQPVENVPAMLDDVDRTRAESVYLLGFKRRAYRELVQRKGELWATVCAIPKSEPARAIQALASVYGLGLVKGAFIAQMLGFDVACLDSRNVAREGLKPRAWRTDGKPVSLAKAQAYVAQTQGRARELWDRWCRDVGQDRGYDPEAVSAFHLAILPPDFIPF